MFDSAVYAFPAARASQVASVFNAAQYRSAIFSNFNTPAALLSRLNLPGTIFHEIGRLNPFFAALRNAQPSSLKPSTEKE